MRLCRLIWFAASRRSDRFPGPFPVFALVAWKSNATGRTLWIKGFVGYTGP